VLILFLFFVADGLKTPPTIDNFDNIPKLKTVQSKQKYPSNLDSTTPKPFSTVDSTLGGMIDQDYLSIILCKYFSLILFIFGLRYCEKNPKCSFKNKV